MPVKTLVYFDIPEDHNINKTGDKTLHVHHLWS